MTRGDLAVDLGCLCEISLGSTRQSVQRCDSTVLVDPCAAFLSRVLKCRVHVDNWKCRRIHWRLLNVVVWETFVAGGHHRRRGSHPRDGMKMRETYFWSTSPHQTYPIHMVGWKRIHRAPHELPFSHAPKPCQSQSIPKNSRESHPDIRHAVC